MTGYTLNNKIMNDYGSIQKGKSIGEPLKSMRFIINFEEQSIKEDIIVNEPYELTCGWLLSQVTRIYESYVNKRKETNTLVSSTEAESRESQLSKHQKIQKRLIVGLKT